MRRSTSMRNGLTWLFCSLALVAIFFGLPSLIFSQGITGDVLGTISDRSGAVVPGAKVTLTGVETGISSATISDDVGNSLFAQLKPGHYRLEISKEGFQP